MTRGTIFHVGKLFQSSIAMMVSRPHVIPTSSRVWGELWQDCLMERRSGQCALIKAAENNLDWFRNLGSESKWKSDWFRENQTTL